MTTPAVNINIASAATYSQIIRNPSGVVVISNSQDSISSRFQRLRSASINSPKRANGTRAPRNWDSSGGVFRQSVQMLRVTRFDGYTYDYLGYLLNPDVLTLVTPVSLEYVASLAIRDALGSFGENSQQLGVALQELKGTGELLAKYYKEAAHGIGKVADAVQSPREGSFRKQMKDFARGWRKAPSRYIEYLYGIKPIADDIANAIDVQTEYKHQGYDFRLTLRGKYRMNDERKEFVRPPPNCTAHIVQKQSFDCKASLVFSLPPWYWDELPTVTPFSQFYDTTRLSFVLDWALPIGDWVRGVEGFQLRPFFKEGSTTVFVRSLGRTVEVQPQVGFSCSSAQLACSEMCYVMSRRAFFSFPSEAVFSLPKLRSVLQLKHMDDAAGLLGQRFAKLSRSLR